MNTVALQSDRIRPNQLAPTRSALLAALATVTATVTGAASSAEEIRVLYAAIDVGSLGGEVERYWGINQNGDLTGSATLQPGDKINRVPFRWTASTGVMEGLRDQFGNIAGGWGVAINDAGTIVGTSGGICTWTTDGVYTNLGVFGGESALAVDINNRGQVLADVTFSDPPGRRTEAVLYTDGDYIVLPRLAYEGRSTPTALNNNGIACGISRAVDNITNPVAWKDGEVIALPRLHPTGAGWAHDVNDHDVVAGYLSTNDPQWPGTAHAVLWTLDGDLIDLHAQHHQSGWTSSRAEKINNRGDVVGFANWPNSTRYNGKMFLYRDGAIIRGSEIEPPNMSVSLDRIYGFNDDGWISVSGNEGPVNRRRIDRGQLLVPVTYSMSLGDPSSVKAGTETEIAISNAEPNARVILMWGIYGGGAPILNCSLHENALQILNPRFLGSVQTDALGAGTYRGVIPPDTAGREILIQAVHPPTCAVSNLVRFTIEE